MPGVRKEYLRAPSVVTPEIENFIHECLEADQEEGLRKQTHTAKRIYGRLVSELNFTGSYSIVRRVVHEMKAHYIQPRRICPWSMIPATPSKLTGEKPLSTSVESGRLSRSSVAGCATALKSLSWPVSVRMQRASWRPGRRCLTTSVVYPGGLSLTMAR